VAFSGRYIIVNLTGQSQLTERKLSGIELSESRLLQIKTCASVYAISESFLSKVAFESDFRKKTFRCVIGYDHCEFGENIIGLHAV